MKNKITRVSTLAIGAMLALSANVTLAGGAFAEEGQQETGTSTTKSFADVPACKSLLDSMNGQTLSMPVSLEAAKSDGTMYPALEDSITAADGEYAQDYADLREIMYVKQKDHQSVNDHVAHTLEDNAACKGEIDGILEDLMKEVPKGWMRSWTVFADVSYPGGTEQAASIHSLLTGQGATFFATEGWKNILQSDTYEIGLSMGIVKDETAEEYASEEEVRAYQIPIDGWLMEYADFKMPVRYLTVVSATDLAFQVNLGYVAMPDDIEFKVKSVAANEMIKKAIGEKEKLIGAYDFELFSEKTGETYAEFAEGAKVRVPLESADADLKNIYARYITQDGKVPQSDVRVEVVKDGDKYYAEFTVYHFSSYAVVSTDTPVVVKTTDAKTPNSGILSDLGLSEGQASAILMIAGAVLAVAGLMTVFGLSRRSAHRRVFKK